MSKKDNIAAWIEHVQDFWLYELDGKSSMRSSSNIIYAQMKDALKAGDFEGAWHAIERLKHLSQPGADPTFDVIRKKDQAETRLMCGLGAFYMEEYQHANLFFNEALGLYSPSGHYRGIVLWLQGCIHWLLVSHVDDAILYWEQACSVYLLQRDIPTMLNWYADRAKEMSEAIKIATQENCPPHPNRVIAPASAGPKAAAKKSKKPTKNHSIHSFPVLGKISAGKMHSVIPLDGKLEIREVFFEDDTPYQPVSLRPGENVINISDSKEYFVLKVTGTSMNTASPEPILNGDYVLMCAQKTAESGDIVAAEIVGVDDLATLKRYKVESGKIVLLPESDDPAFQDPISIRREFKSLNDNFYIRGIALAVFKRSED